MELDLSRHKLHATKHLGTIKRQLLHQDTPRYRRLVTIQCTTLPKCTTVFEVLREPGNLPGYMREVLPNSGRVELEIPPLLHFIIVIVVPVFLFLCLQ